MTRKFTRKTPNFRSIAPFITVLTVMIALAALGQTRGTVQASWKSFIVPASANISGTSPALRKGGGNPVRGLAGQIGPDPLIFMPAVDYNSGGNLASSGAVADVNGDGKPDLIAANGTAPGSVGVLLGNGDGTFRPVVTYPSGGNRASSVAVADVNGDGRPDLLALNSSGACTGCANSSVAVLCKPRWQARSAGCQPTYRWCAVR